MRSLLLMIVVLGACTATPKAAEPIAQTAPASSSTRPDPTITTTTRPAPDAPVIYPFQSEASIEEALQSPARQPEDFDWGLDYVQWVVGWDQAVAYDGLEGTDQWATFYRSSQDELIYVAMRILGYRPDNSPLVGVTIASTFFDLDGFDVSVAISEDAEGWFAEVAMPPLADLDLPPETTIDVMLQFESAVYEVTTEMPTIRLALSGEPHADGVLQVAFRDSDGHAVAWHAMGVGR